MAASKDGLRSCNLLSLSADFELPRGSISATMSVTIALAVAKDSPHRFTAYRRPESNGRPQDNGGADPAAKDQDALFGSFWSSRNPIVVRSRNEDHKIYGSGGTWHHTTFALPE